MLTGGCQCGAEPLALDTSVDFSTAIHIWTSRKLAGLAIPAGAVQHPREP